jgi:glutathione synthase/RimK-type ligase-like ATP-grasp enzyme
MSFKIAIHSSSGSFSDRWIKYCDQKGVPYKIVDCYRTDIIDQLKECSALLWHHHHAGAKDIVFAKQLLFSLQHAGLRVFPNFKTGWHFDDKVAQKYLAEVLQLPAVPAYVFYSKKDALAWAEKTSFPKVFKLRGGAGSANVLLVKSRVEAVRLIHKAFGSGFTTYQPVSALRERWRKYRVGKGSLFDVAKGVARLAILPKSAVVAGKERGYAYFQDFISGNDHDIRVVVIANKAFAIKRMVRKNDFRASGSGSILYEKKYFPDQLIDLSFQIATKVDSQCLAMDYVFHNDEPLLVEMSFGFSHGGYDQCEGYWTPDLRWHEGPFNPQSWIIDEIIA